MSDDGQEAKLPDRVPFSLVWDRKNIDEVPSVYANQILITHAGSEFYLIFGEAVPPIILRKEDMPPEEQRDVIIKPVAKVAIAKDAMEGIAKAIFKNWQDSSGEQEPQHEP